MARVLSAKSVARRRLRPAAFVSTGRDLRAENSRLEAMVAKLRLRNILLEEALLRRSVPKPPGPLTCGL